MGISNLIPFTVYHKRFFPKVHEFTYRFFWFEVDLLRAFESTPLIGFNQKGIYSYYDSDHFSLGGETLLENIKLFLAENGIRGPFKKVRLYTQLRFLGYVFNPVSFISIIDSDDNPVSIIEIGNTFNEIKPYFVPTKAHNDSGLFFSTAKYFYISPFIAHDNRMDFDVKEENGKLSIGIKDFKENQLELFAGLKGRKVPFSGKTLFAETIRVPFGTFKTIFLIHWHAFLLWFKGIPFYKKDERQDLQRGFLKWKS